jgi:hypothetical protein
MTHDAKLSTGKRLQGAVDARHRACRRTAVLQMPGNAADAVPCERLQKIILSVSRRSDIPAFYMDWFMTQIRKGFFEVTNPFNGKRSMVPATPRDVHAIVLWSKDYGTFLDHGLGEQLNAKGYRLFFNFTVNSGMAELEPNVPELSHRLRQMETLCTRFDPRTVNWRFDPICFFRVDGGPEQNNLADFTRIADTASHLGISRCITSFMDHYPKIKKRAIIGNHITFNDPPLEKKVEILLRMEKTLQKRDIALNTCCEKRVVAGLPPDSTIAKSSCIPGRLLADLFPGKISLKKDTGQRQSGGCGCTVSKDVGSYRHHPCYHNCIFCYANPSPPKKIRGEKKPGAAN